MSGRRARAGARARGGPAAAAPRGPLPDAARALLAIPPARFTAAREELARTLATEDPPAAAAVRALRRPVGLAWLLNRAARDAPREVDALLSAADLLREGPDRHRLREAEEALRASARALRLAAGRAAEEEGARAVDLPRVELLLRVAAAADAGTRDALRRGALVREPEGTGFGAGPPTGPAGIPSPTKPPRAARPPGPGADGGPPARARPEGAARAARRREREEAVRVRRHARELERARRTLREAERAAEAARREAERLEAGARTARERADRAEAHVSRARAALEALERP